VKTAEFNYW